MPSHPPTTESIPSNNGRADPRPGDVLSLDLQLLDDNPFQPRKHMDPVKLQELASSIAQSGQLQPIAVRPASPGRYQVVAGGRRTAAFRMLLAAAKTESERRKYALIRAQVVTAVTDSEMAIAAYDENAKRADLTPLEEALALACIRDLGGNLSATEVARLTSQPERRVRRLLKLAAAPRVVTDAVSTGMLVDVADEGAKPKRERRLLELMAALEFARLHDFYLQSKPTTADERTTAAMTRALTGNWGFRRIQTYVDGILKAATGPTTAPQKDIPEQPITAPHPAAAEEALPEKSADEAGKGSMTKSAPEERDRETVVSSARTSGLFRLYVDRLKAASRAQLEAARTTIDDARRLIDAQLELLDQTGG